jgi:septal ring factor EnvC (AmiA/AmiB activator)
MKQVLFFSVCLCLNLAIATGAIADLAENRAQLERIKSRILKAEQALDEKENVQLDVSHELALLDQALRRAEERTRQLATEQGQTKKKIVLQQQRIQDNRAQTRTLFSRLKKRLVALYKEGDAGPLKVLFSADSPAEMARHYHYLTRILQRDQELLAAYRQAFNQQQQSLARLQELEQHQAGLLARAKEQRQLTQDSRRLKARLLAQARSEQQQIEQSLARLKTDATRLMNLIEKLERQAEAEDPGPIAGNFAVGRGKLRWPLNGPVVIGYGQQKDANLGTYYESNGIVIAAPPGSPIRAVAAGKIVFADYFKGYGNLYILSHPGGYHSLYAHTDRMQKKLGEKVSAGDLLGYSGRDGRDTIYFEIRSQGSPVNPLSWLKHQ